MRILLANFTKMVGDSGGLAKVNVAFANEMVRRGHTVTTVYSDDLEGDFFYPLDERVTAYNLRHFRGQTHLFPISYKIRREILRAFSERKGRAVNLVFVEKYLLPYVRTILDEAQPDVIVSFQPASSKVLLSNLQTRVPVITMSHGDPEDYFHTYPTEELPSLSLSSVCQVLLPIYEEHLRTHLLDIRIEVIGNVVPQYEQQANLAQNKETYKILFVGRLVRSHKRPHLLIEAFIKIAAEFPNWILELWGAEDNRRYQKELKKKIAAAGLAERIHLCGTTSDIPRVLQSSDLCVAPSASEGFSLAHTEAMSMGLPLIGYRSCVSLSALIRDGENGLLTEDGVESLAEKMAILMRDRDLRARMGQAARDSMRAYAPEIIWARWEQLMREVADSRTDI
ncbi:glycosyltransferase [uncultured Selenomonas sp.]|uniref:glycosyltransferase n=1 Tax=uncultured Selenomonas sp. TaxID=159275 RepID=UPI0028D4975C|nr:glycosyltransferase [uncultured Selenomonas sp.]